MAMSKALSRSGALALALLLCCTLAQAQTFPCPAQTSSLASSPSSNSPAVAGGYSNIDPETLNNNDLLDISLATNASFAQWVEQDGNFTICDDLNNIVGPVEFGILQICSQVVAGTNYGIRFVAQYSCIANDDTLGQDNLVLNAIVYVPLPMNGQDAEPQVQDVWLDTAVPVEQVELPVQFVALPPGTEDPFSDDDNNDDSNDGSNDDSNVLAANPTPPSSPSPSPPYTLEGL